MRVISGSVSSGLLMAAMMLASGCKPVVAPFVPPPPPQRGPFNQHQISCSGGAPNRICKITLKTLTDYGTPCVIDEQGNIGSHGHHKIHDPFSLSIPNAERLMVIPTLGLTPRVRFRAIKLLPTSPIGCNVQPFNIGSSTSGFGDDLTGLPIPSSVDGCQYELVVQAEEEGPDVDPMHPDHTVDAADPVDLAHPEGLKHHYFCVDPHFEMLR